MKKHFVPNEVCFTSSSCRSGTRSGLLGDQQWPKAPSAPPGSLGFIRRGQSLGEPAHNGPNAVLATLLGLTGHWIHSPRALHAGSSLIYSSSNNWIPQPDQLVLKKKKIKVAWFKFKLNPAAVTLLEVLDFALLDLVIPELTMGLAGAAAGYILVMDPALHRWEIKMEEPFWSTSQKNPHLKIFSELINLWFFFFLHQRSFYVYNYYFSRFPI